MVNGEKMSKSRGNVVNPDDIVESYGADTLRMYEMFMGPLEQTKPWNTHGAEVAGAYYVKADVGSIVCRRLGPPPGSPLFPDFPLWGRAGADFWTVIYWEI